MPKIKPLNLADTPDAAAAMEGWANNLADTVGSWSESFQEGIDGVTERLDAMETRGQRIPTEKANARAEAWDVFCRYGEKRLTDQHRNSLVASDDVKGGYMMAPPAFESAILKTLEENSPIRALSTVRTISSGSVSMVRQTSRPEAQWVAETELRPETTMSYGRVSIPVHTASCYIDVSLEALEDSAYDVASEITMEFGKAYARLENRAHIEGTGAGQPLGILNTAGVENVASGAAATVTADALGDVYYDLEEGYADAATWVGARRTIGTVRALKDGSGRYLWVDSIQAGTPPSLHSRPFLSSSFMPGIAAGSRPLLFGDFASACRIYDRVGLSIMRDDYTKAATGEIRFWGRRRTSFAVVAPEALRTLYIATEV
ncbi:MAG: phage major capsid protein [Devosia sp.]